MINGDKAFALLYHADAQKCHEQQSATSSRATQAFVSAAGKQNTAEWPSEHGHKCAAR
ncbi:MAG: hypothetical protein ACLS3M_09485 [Collinsella sp.]